MNKKITVKEVYTLPAVYRNESYYNKAHVIVLSNGVRLLKSYETIVAGINTRGNFFRLWDGWSATTAKHLTAFSMLYAKKDQGYHGKKDWNDMKVDTVASAKYSDFWRTPTKAYAPTMYSYWYW